MTGPPRLRHLFQVVQLQFRLMHPHAQPAPYLNFLHVSFKSLIQIGADAVGMSTAHEVIVAAHSGMQCLGISLITNAAELSYDVSNDVSHEEVIQAGKKRSKDVEKLVKCFVQKLN